MHSESESETEEEDLECDECGRVSDIFDAYIEHEEKEIVANNFQLKTKLISSSYGGPVLLVSYNSVIDIVVFGF